jgi:GntR family transcriptional regulator
VEIEIDYEAPEPPHRQIAAWLRGKIESGELQPGRKIPSEKDIMDLSGVARTTVRRAVKVLRDEGLVVTTPGRGTHVTKRLSRGTSSLAMLETCQFKALSGYRDLLPEPVDAFVRERLDAG